VPLEDAREAARKLDEEYLRHPAFRGMRHLNHDEADPDWLIRPTVLAGLRELQSRKLVYEVVAVYPLHLGHVPTLAAALPDLTIVVDHLAKPPIASGDLAAWKRDLAAAAAHPNVLAKVSGLNTVTADAAAWTGADLVEAIGFAIEVFGVDRLMVGSDWPVAILAGDYAKVWTEARRAFELLGLTAAERAALEGGTAARVYGIGGAA
jgi:L-fuconolactonase